MAEVDLSELGATVGKIGALLAGPELRKVTNAVARESKKIGMRHLTGDLGGDRKFTNWRPRLSVGYELENEGVAKIIPRPSGPWKVLDQGRGRGSRIARRGAYKGRRVGWGPTAGRGTWTSGAGPEIIRGAPARVDEAVQDAIRKALRG